MNFKKMQLCNKYGNEQVFVVSLASTLHIKDKFTKTNEKQNIDLSFLKEWDSIGKYIFRYDAEYNEALQQLIPYTLITNKKGDKYYISYRLTGDNRLVGFLSIGFGGHINPIDGYSNVITKAAVRELNEEVDIKLIKNSLIEFIGYVRDLNSKTKEHLGFVMSVKARSVKIKEINTLKGVWMDLPTLVKNYFKFESWSKYIIDYLFMANNEQGLSKDREGAIKNDYSY